MDVDMVFNRDVKRRDSILKEFFMKKMGRHYFEGLTTEVVQQLVDEKFLDPADCQNNSPTAGEFLEFMKKYTFVQADGYAIDVERDDYRVTIVGIVAKMSDRNDLDKCTFMIDFCNLCGGADEYRVDEDIVGAWWS